jgi:hypothetical protein
MPKQNLFSRTFMSCIKDLLSLFLLVLQRYEKILDVILFCLIEFKKESFDEIYRSSNE